jgi:ATP/ADP translocase
MDGYPLLEMFLTIFWFFLFIAWISCVVTIFRDIFRSGDLSGAAKASWTFLVFILPVLGVLVYLVARGSSMQRRDDGETARRARALPDPMRSPL